jgi:MATE family multidrug resistance protein
MLRLAVPVVVIQVGMMAMGVVDTIMVGHISARALAAVALGNLYFFGLAVFAMGTLMVLDPVVAQAFGAGDRAAVGRAVQRGVLLAALLTIPVALLLTMAARPRRVPFPVVCRVSAKPPIHGPHGPDRDCDHRRQPCQRRT